MNSEYKGIVFRNFLVFGMCCILRVLNCMGQFRKVVFYFLNGFLSDMALYNKFGLSLFGFAPGNYFQLESQKFGVVLFRLITLDFSGLISRPRRSFSQSFVAWNSLTALE